MSVENLEELCDKVSQQRHMVIGVDVQDVLGPPAGDDNLSILGDFVEATRSHKGEFFLRLCLEKKLAVLNTLNADPN
eukprot:1662607-Karenia_brevis.AAC.1